VKAMFVVGAPGVGKTTAMRALFKRWDPSGLAFLNPSPKWTVALGSFAAAGHYTGDAFDGADTVPYSGAKAALELLEKSLKEWEPRVVVFDGDRFSHKGALDVVSGLMPSVCVQLVAPKEVLEQRRKERGSNQNAQWLTGRATKSQRFAELFGERLLKVDAATSDPDAIASQIEAFLLENA
jgi:hypothetical protein